MSPKVSIIQSFQGCDTYFEKTKMSNKNIPTSIMQCSHLQDVNQGVTIQSFYIGSKILLTLHTMPMHQPLEWGGIPATGRHQACQLWWVGRHYRAANLFLYCEHNVYLHSDRLFEELEWLLNLNDYLLMHLTNELYTLTATTIQKSPFTAMSMDVTSSQIS